MADLLRGGIAINEILANPGSGSGYDTDGSGTVSATDEYIELVNTSGTAIDISGLQLWDAGVGNYFTFPAGSVLQPGAHALVVTNVSSGGSLPAGGADDLFFNAGRGSAVINNGGDNVTLYDPGANEYVSATFNGAALDDPAAGGGGYSRFPTTATRVGAGEDFGTSSPGVSVQRAPDGSDVFVADTPTPGVSNVCFAAGTALAAPHGATQVEALRAGDLLVTLDHGAQAVTWVFAKTWTAQDMAQNANIVPVRIRQGSLGNGLPQRDLLVSQQHRILVQGPIAARMYGGDVLIAAKHLTALPGIDIICPDTAITYYHVMLDQHQVLYAEGLPTESLYLGAQSLKAIPPEGLREIEAIMGATAAELMQRTPPAARHFAKGKRAKALVGRHSKNGKPLTVTTAA